MRVSQIISFSSAHLLLFAIASPDPHQLHPDLFRPPSAAHAPDLSSNHALANLLGRRSTQGSELLGTLFARQQFECPDPNGPSCSATTCCLSNEECCGTTKCCDKGDICQSFGCCPRDAQTCSGTMCKPAGSVCCGTYACESGYVCNIPAGGCCLPDEIKCSTTCCPQGSTCADIPGYCSTLRSTTSSSYSTSTSTLLSTSKAYSTSYSISYSTTTISCTPSPSVQKRSQGPHALVDEPIDEFSQLDKRKRYPWPTTCIKVCHSSGQQLPLIEIQNIPGETDELIESMCAGMDGWYKRQKSGVHGAGTIYTDPANGEDVLTYDGPTRTNPAAKQRRNEVKCDGFCLQATQQRGIAMECDEYPPAMVQEGGRLATLVCVPAWQNSRTQGPIFGRFVTVCDLQKGDKFLVRLQGGCSQFSFPPRRDRRRNDSLVWPRAASAATLQISDSNATLCNPNGDGSLTYVAVDLGELQAGHYDIEARFSGSSVAQAVVLNQYGDSYAVIDTPISSSAHLTFDVTDNMSLPAAVIAYTEQPVNLSYFGSVQLRNGTNATQTGAATTSSSAKASIAVAFAAMQIVTLVLLSSLGASVARLL